MGTMSPTTYDTNEANWIDPGLSITQDSRYAPYAAITIDAYSGPPPATSYPDVTYPASSVLRFPPGPARGPVRGQRPRRIFLGREK
jgi:hypothetical protein